MSFLEKYPTDIIVTTGYSCNNNCLFCYINSNRSCDKTSAQIKRELDNAKKLGINSVHFDGGEPTIRKDILQLIGYAKRSGFKKVTLVSNGRMLVYPDFSEKLANSGLTILLISLHGHNAYIHDYLTRVQGSFSQLTRGIKIFKKKNKTVVLGINVVINKFNYRFLSEIVKFSGNLGINWLNFIYICPIGKAFVNKEIIPRYRDITPFVEAAIDQNKHYNISLQNIPFCLIKEGTKRILNEARWKGKSLVKLPGESKIKLKDKLDGMKEYISSCNSCMHQNECGGIWKNYLKVYGYDEFLNRDLPLKGVEHSYPFFKAEQLETSSGKKMSSFTFCPAKSNRQLHTSKNAKSLFFYENGKLFRYQREEGIPNKAFGIISRFGQVFINKGDKWPDHLYPAILNNSCINCKKLKKNLCFGYYKENKKNVLFSSENEECLIAELKNMKGRVLDIGCGSGCHTEVISRLILSEKISYCGVDPDQQSLDLLKMKLPDKYQERVRLINKPIEDINFGKNIFDVILMIRSYSHILDLDKTLVNMKNALKSKGVLLIMDNSYFSLINPVLSPQKDSPWASHFRVHVSNKVIGTLNNHGFKVTLHKPIKPKEGCWLIKCELDNEK